MLQTLSVEQNILYGAILRCFDAILVLSRFTHFCVERNELNIPVCGAKLTNMMYVYKYKLNLLHFKT